MVRFCQGPALVKISLGRPLRHPACHPCHLPCPFRTDSYISLDNTFALSFGPSVKAQDLIDAQLSLANRMLTGVSTSYVDQTTSFREIVISEPNLPGFTDMLTNGTIRFMLSRCVKAFAGYSSIRVSKVPRAYECECHASPHSLCDLICACSYTQPCAAPALCMLRGSQLAPCPALPPPPVPRRC